MLKVLALALALSTAVPTGNPNESEGPRPVTFDISAVRYLLCQDSEGNAWSGSGFLIGNHVMATALHVVKNAKCYDVMANAQVVTFKTDPKHDLAIVTSPKLPTDIPYVKISCDRFKTKQTYLSWGITSYGFDWDKPIARMNSIVATKDYTQKGYTLDDGTPAEGMRAFNGDIAPGMSGGPVTDLLGYAHAVNNAGDEDSTILYEFADGILCTNTQ